MKKPLILIASLVLTLSLKSQDYAREFGSPVSKAEADLKVYIPDKTAEAVVIFDKGKSTFKESPNGSDYDVIFTRETRIKILSDAGIKWGEIEIPFYRDGKIYEQILELQAFTYNPTGESFTKTIFNNTNAHDEIVNEYWRLKKFAMPDVRAGSIIEYRYVIRSQDKFNLRDWNFQSGIPTIYSEYQVWTVPFYTYSWFLQGSGKFDSKTSRTDQGLKRQFGPIIFNDVIDTYVMRNIPAFKDEEFITSVNDYIIKLDFQLTAVTNTNGAKTQIISTWEDLIKALLKDESVCKFAGRFEKLAEKMINPASLSTKTEKEKFDHVMNYVKTNYNWNKSNAKFASKTPADLMKDKIGNSADINLLAVGLLNSCGLKAHPVFISTRDHGRIKFDAPLLSAFNYVAIYAEVDGQQLITDATQVMCPNNIIPPKCINDKGLIIKEGNVEWIPLQTNLLSEVKTEIEITPGVSQLVANTNLSATNFEALAFRNRYGNNKTKISERLNEGGFKIDEESIKFAEADNKELPFSVNYVNRIFPEIISGKIYLSPFMNECQTDNPLKQTNRTYPIDMTYPVRKVFISRIVLPENYKVDYVPENYKVSNENFEIIYSTSKDDKALNIHFEYSFKKPIYQAKDYNSLKFYFMDIIKKGNDKVVLAPVG